MVPDALSHVSETAVPVRVRSISAIVRPVVVDARGYPWSGIHVHRHYGCDRQRYALVLADARQPLETADGYRDGCSGTPDVGAHPVSAGRVRTPDMPRVGPRLSPAHCASSCCYLKRTQNRDDFAEHLGVIAQNGLEV